MSERITKYRSEPVLHTGMTPRFDSWNRWIWNHQNTAPVAPASIDGGEVQHSVIQNQLTKLWPTIDGRWILAPIQNQYDILPLQLDFLKLPSEI